MDGFGVAGGVGIDLLVGGVGDVSVGVAGFGLKHTLEKREVMLSAPEAAASEVDVAYRRMERGIGVGEDVGQLFETEAVGVVEGAELVAIDVEDGPDGFFFLCMCWCVSVGDEQGDNNLAAGLGAAGDVAGELLDVGHDDATLLLPGGTANTLAEGDIGASDRTLECGKNKLVAGDTIEACPPESEGVVKEGCGIGEERYEVDRLGGELTYLLNEELVFFGFCRHRKNFVGRFLNVKNVTKIKSILLQKSNNLLVINKLYHKPEETPCV